MQNVIIKVFPTLAEVAPAVASGAVDLVFGLDTIGPQEFKALHLQVRRGDGPLRYRCVSVRLQPYPTYRTYGWGCAGAASRTAAAVCGRVS